MTDSRYLRPMRRLKRRMGTKARVFLRAGLAFAMAAGALSPFPVHSSQASAAAVTAHRTAATALTEGAGRTQAVPTGIGAAANKTFTVNGLRVSIRHIATSRTGWYLVVYCDCFFPTEKIFETDLATMFRAVAAVINGEVIVERATKMVVPDEGGKVRIPDIYYKRPFQAINELKIGKQSITKHTDREAFLDTQLLAFGYGIHKGQHWPISSDTWWFAPNKDRKSGPSVNLANYLYTNGINIIVILYKHKSKKWPRSQPMKDKEREVKGFEGNNQANAIWAAEHMFTPDGCDSLPSCLAEFHGAAS